MATEETANGIVITDSATADTVSSDAFAVNTTSSETDVADHPLYERINSVLRPRETFRVQNVLITQNGDNLTIQYDSRQMYNKDVFVTVKTTIRKLDPMPSEENQFAMIEYFKERFPSFAGFRRWDRRFNRKYESVQERERNHFGHYYWDILADGYPTVFVYQGTAYEVFSEFEDQPETDLASYDLLQMDGYSWERTVEVNITDCEREDALVRFAENKIAARSVKRLYQQRLGGMNVILAALDERVEADNVYSDDYRYLLFYEGEWEDTHFSLSELSFAAAFPGHSGIDLKDAEQDINFDGHPDLFLKLGIDGGTGGSFVYYHVFQWDPEKKEFVEERSFPKQVNVLDLDNQRVLCVWRGGYSEDGVDEYKIVDGLWTETRNLRWVHRENPDYKAPGDKEYINEMRYYEMEELVETTDVSEMESNEIYNLYPDLDFWRRG